MASNHLKGEVEITIDGTVYTLCFTSNCIVEIEQLLGQSIGEIAQDLAKVEHQRALLWGALQKHHPRTDLLKTGDLLDAFDGGLQTLAEKLARALRFRISRTPIDAPLGEEEAPAVAVG